MTVSVVAVLEVLGAMIGAVGRGFIARSGTRCLRCH